jgi:hypothetical protein
MAPRTMSLFTDAFLLDSLQEQAEGHATQPHTIKRFHCRGGWGADEYGQAE